MGQLVDRGLRLPIGLYRGDGLLGSMVCHALDAVHEPWANARVPSIADATFAFPVILPLRPSHLRRQFRRMVRQARGRIENAAIKRIIGIGGYEALPAYADDMLRQHLAEHGQPVVSSHARLFQALAIAELNRAVRPAAESLIPERIP